MQDVPFCALKRHVLKAKTARFTIQDKTYNKKGRMTEERKEPYIEQHEAEDALYTRLHRQMREEIQRLSGKVWTDYNAHDPGVTLADVADYALTELDYKLGFPLTDYLTEENGELDLRRFGLFPPEEVYTTHPVTEEDYRRLFLASIPRLAGVTVTANKETGGYTVRIMPSPFEEEGERKVLEEQVRKVFHSHRNLCEYLEKVETVSLKELEFRADFEIEAGEDADDVLARLYLEILEYLYRFPTFSTPDKDGEGTSPSEWLEGQAGTVRVAFPERQDTEHELYGRLCRVKGVRSFKTCYLTLDGKPQNDFSGGFGLHIPEEEPDLEYNPDREKKNKEPNVHIRQGKQDVQVDTGRFRTRLETLYRIREHRLEHKVESATKTAGWTQPAGTYRDVYGHYPIANDFPACYRLSKDGKANTPFEAYLKLYDQVIEGGLRELKELPQVLSLSDEDAGNLSDRRTRELKRQYLDFLDRLYGVDSNPAWLAEHNRYGETEEGTLRRRMRFLRNVPVLLRDRSKARDITDSEALTGNGTPTVKRWFCLLLGISPDDGRAVSNVLPAHNLLITEKRDGRPFRDIDSLLIHERMLEADNVEKVDYMELASDEKEKQREYGRMWHELHLLNENRISGDLFRGGTDLDNYRVVRCGREEYLLAYRNREHRGWTNLGRSADKERLKTLANILRRFLRELNRACETLYIVEPVLADKSRPFQVFAVLPAWTARFHSPRFREECRRLLRSLLPAHIDGTVYWLDERDMRMFESCYRQWIYSLTDIRIGEYRKLLLDAMLEAMETAVEKQDLDDTY